MASKPRPTTSRPRTTSSTTTRATGTRTTRRRKSASWTDAITPDVVRSIMGTVLMALGAIALIALLLPGQGKLTDTWRDAVAPWFQTGRWLLPFLLLGGGWYVAAGPGKRPNSGWGMTLAGLTLAYVSALGAFEVLDIKLFGLERGGGIIGRFLESILEPLLTAPGAFILLVALTIVGLMLAFNLQLREIFRPVTGTARWVGATAATSMRREPAPDGANPAKTAKPAAEPKPAGKPIAPVPVMADAAAVAAATKSILDEPPTQSGGAPISRTVWTGETTSRPPVDPATAAAAASLAGVGAAAPVSGVQGSLGLAAVAVADPTATWTSTTTRPTSTTCGPSRGRSRPPTCSTCVSRRDRGRPSTTP